MWNLTEQKEKQRTYTNSTTGSKCLTDHVYTDKEGNNWFMFRDLMTLPFTRTMAANKISSLYQLGLTSEDANIFFTKHKATLKSTDAEKYEKAYAETLEFEAKFKSATDPVKQMSSLVCVYFLLNDEPIDAFEHSLQIRKMGILEAEPEAHSFFLNLEMRLIEDYTAHLNLISQIVSSPQNGNGAAST
jgi:hypothetical protein